MRLRREGAAAATAVLALVAAGCGGSQSLPVVTPAVVVPPVPAVVDAREWGTRDVALARTPGRATVSVVDDQGHGVDGLAVRIDGRPAAACRNGCYRGAAAAGPVLVQIGGRSWRFTIPASAPSGRVLLRRAMAAYAGLRTAALHQQLSSGPEAPLVTDFVFVAPNRLRYAIHRGSQAVVIGSSRWDRPSTTGTWQRSPQDPVHVMRLPWQRAIDVHLVAPHTVTFFDLATHAWFRVALEPASGLPATERMTGISHFMLNRYSGYNAPVKIGPP
jgi:hypothetical protein